MSREDYEVCVNTALIDRHLAEQDKADEAFQYVYDKMVYMFKDDLESVKCIEDIHDDLIFEAKWLIDRDDWDVDANDIATEIYKDFDIKGA